MNWVELQRVYPDRPLWGAIDEPYQYVMSYEPETFKFIVSAKVFPNAGKIEELGEYLSRTDAELACTMHWWRNRK